MSYDTPRFQARRSGQPERSGWAAFTAELGAWYMDPADRYVPLGQRSGIARVMVHSRLDDRFEAGWLGVLSVAPDGAMAAAWTGHGHVAPSPAHVVGWRLNQTQRYRVLTQGCRGGGALVLAQNRHRQEQQSVGLLALGPDDHRLRATWAAERIIPARRPGGPAWDLHHGDRYLALGGSTGNEPVRLLARGRGGAGTTRPALGIVSFEPDSGGLVTDWLGGAALPPRSAGLSGWLMEAGDRFHPLPSVGPGEQWAVLAQRREPAHPGRHGLAVLSWDAGAGGLVVDWSAGSILHGPSGTYWRVDPADRYTVAAGTGRRHGCTLIIQSRGADAASIPSLAVVSLDADARAFRVETTARGVVPPADGDGPAWRLDRQDKLHVLGSSGRAGTCALLVHRRARDRSERQRLGVLSYDPANGGLLTDWVASDQLPARQSGSLGWRPDPLDRFTPLEGDAGAPGRSRLIAQSRSLGDPDRSCAGVLSYRGPGAGLVTEHVSHDVLPPLPFPRR